jgi:hypothetical protein
MRKSAIRCSICGKAAPPGALLCPPCRAALKRAGHLTVQDLPHYLAPVRRPGGKGRRPADARRPAPGMPAKPAPTAPASGRRVLAGVAALGVLAGIAYVGQPPPVAHDAPQAGSRSAPVLSPAAKGAPVAPVAASLAPVATSPMPPAPGPVATVTDPPRPVAARVPARAKQVALRAEAVVTESVLPVPDSTPPAPPPPPAPVPREAPPPPDRWQQMSDALARCDREGGFSGFICDQRVRLDSCEGFWGKVPQCPNPPENPR